MWAAGLTSRPVPRCLPEEFSELVVATLEVNILPRMGFRVWTLYPTASLDAGRMRFPDVVFHPVCRLDKPRRAIVPWSHSVVVAPPDRMVRVAVTPF